MFQAGRTQRGRVALTRHPDTTNREVTMKYGYLLCLLLGALTLSACGTTDQSALRYVQELDQPREGIPDVDAYAALPEEERVRVSAAYEARKKAIGDRRSTIRKGDYLAGDPVSWGGEDSPLSMAVICAREIGMATMYGRVKDNRWFSGPLQESFVQVSVDQNCVPLMVPKPGGGIGLEVVAASVAIETPTGRFLTEQFGAFAQAAAMNAGAAAVTGAMFKGCEGGNCGGGEPNVNVNYGGTSIAGSAAEAAAGAAANTTMNTLFKHAVPMN
jgi:hypothetical protein